MCGPGVTESPFGYQDTDVPVCVVTCQYVPAPVPTPNGQRLCVGWTDHNGSPTALCTP